MHEPIRGEILEQVLNRLVTKTASPVSHYLGKPQLKSESHCFHGILSRPSSRLYSQTFSLTLWSPLPWCSLSHQPDWQRLLTICRICPWQLSKVCLRPFRYLKTHTQTQAQTNWSGICSCCSWLLSHSFISLCLKSACPWKTLWFLFSVRPCFPGVCSSYNQKDGFQCRKCIRCMIHPQTIILSWCDSLPANSMAGSLQSLVSCYCWRTSKCWAACRPASAARPSLPAR